MADDDDTETAEEWHAAQTRARVGRLEAKMRNGGGWIVVDKLLATIHHIRVAEVAAHTGGAPGPTLEVARQILAELLGIDQEP